MKNTLKKITCATLAAVSVFGCAATLTACKTSHPKVEMQLSFNNETYTLDYKLYRKIAPATVDHFLFLAGNGYYDGLCVHDYKSAQRMYTGGYSVTKDNPTELVYKRYFDEISTYDNFDEFPHSVWMDEAKTNPTYTLKGEFVDNHFEVENGALKESFGSLSMYYNTLDDSTLANTKIYGLRASEEGEVDKLNYGYNRATSLFFISLSTSLPTNNNYCTFATLDEDSQATLEKLQEAIDEYIDSNHTDDEDFVTDVTVKVYEDDEILNETEETETFYVPQAPIVIEKVKVKKY